MKNRIVALALTLAMVLSIAVASAATIPGNVADIADLPAVPSVPAMKVKANDHVATVTLSQEVDYINAWWSWVPTAIEMNGTTGTYRVDGHKNQVGTGTFGSLSKTEYEGEIIKDKAIDINSTADPQDWKFDKNGKFVWTVPYDVRTVRTSDYNEWLMWHNGRKGDPTDSHFTWTGTWANGGGRGKAYTYVWRTGKGTNTDPYEYWAQDMSGTFGWYDMGFAYDLGYTDEEGRSVHVWYDRFGNAVKVELFVPGYDPFMGENPASGATITWVVVIRGSKYYEKRVWIVDSIKVTYDEGDVASITGVYRHPNKNYTGKLVDWSVENR